MAPKICQSATEDFVAVPPFYGWLEASSRFPTTAGTGGHVVSRPHSCRHDTQPWNKLSPFFVFFIWFQSAGRFFLEQATEIGLHVTLRTVDFSPFGTSLLCPTAPGTWRQFMSLLSIHFLFKCCDISFPARCLVVLRLHGDPASLLPFKCSVVMMALWRIGAWSHPFDHAGCSVLGCLLLLWRKRGTAGMGRIRPVTVVNNYVGPRCLLSRSEA